MPMRLMVGLHRLKHREQLSAAAVGQGMHANLYWMMCGGIEVGTILEQTLLGNAQWPISNALGVRVTSSMYAVSVALKRCLPPRSAACD
jgi:hypothetical protein